jgi:serine/threonine protein kinase/TPR repeat protein
MPETVSFEHYEVLTRDDGSLYELGRGAMGVTYKAFDTSLKVPVALKVINATYLNSEVAQQRFIREAQSAAKLRHRNVATVYHLGTEGDAWFYAMEFIDGETVDALVKRHGPLEPALALQIAAQVARALNAAVPHALVHRDIKPANLMLVREDDELVVKVIDFGLALTSLPGEAHEEKAGSFVGTPHFASPEQLQSRDIDVRSDIYSLGVTLWLMLAGTTPFTGPVEQVKRKHLAEEPPFEQFQTLPEPVQAILRRALEKDAAKRYQTPAEFRRAVEECLDEMGEAGAEERDLTSLLADAQQRAGESQFETNAVIAGFCKIVESTGDTNIGRTFRCYDPERQRHIRLLVLNQDFGAGGTAYTQIEREVEKIVPVQHENLVAIYEFATIEGSSFLVMEWTEGFSVLELLRARRELESSETLALLEQAARGAEYALGAGLKCIDFALHQIAIHFATPVDKETLLRTPLLAWPPFTVKLNPLGVTHEIAASETWAGGQTMVQAREPGAEIDARARYVQALGAVAYELLGGAVSPLQAPGSIASRYTPLSTLSEEGNEVLKRALNPAESFAGPQAFYAALKELEVLGIRRPEASRHFPTTGSGLHSSPALAAERPGQPPATARRRVPVKFFGGLVTVALIAAAAYFLAPHRPQDAPASPAPEPLTDAPPATPAVADRTKPEPENPAATDVPTNPQTPAEIARAVQLHDAVSTAESAERGGDPVAAIAAWLQVARAFPEAEAPRRRLDFIIDPLRKRTETHKPEIFETLRPLLVEAAQLDILSAVMLLAEAQKTVNPRESYAWYSAAAARGNPEACVQMGLLVSNGVTEGAGLEQAFYYFNLAAEAGDPAGKLLVGECYVFGKGTPVNFETGLRWLREAADQGNLRAVNRLADAHRHGMFNLPVNYDEAFRLWSRVAESRDPLGQDRKAIGEATANLAVLYMNGWGTVQDQVRGVKLFTEGTRLGDPNAMYFLALCHQTGQGGAAQNASLTLELMKRAATAGSKQARAWCQKNGVAYAAP